MPESIPGFGARLREAMRRAGVRNDQVAEATGVHVKTVSPWLNDRQRPSEENIEKLAELLGVSAPWLRYGTGGPSGYPEVTDQPAAVTPRVSAGLPHRLRVWLQTELTEYAKARISDADFIEARSALEAPEVIGFFVGGGGGETSEDDVLEDMKLMARAIRRRLIRGGAKLSPNPAD